MDKWLDIMEDRFILWEPGSFTYSGHVGPITASRPIIGASFIPQSRASPTVTQRVIHWKVPLVTQNTGRAITIDFPHEHLRKVETTLAQLTPTEPLVWDTPTISLASTKTQKTIHGTCG